MRYIPLLFSLTFSFGVISAQQTFISRSEQVQLIELYTSQGCSSCPPAEKWLTSFLDNKRLWQEVTPVNFHVDYWDNLGWPDRYASSRYTQRQRKYKAIGNSKTVGTPGFIIDGHGWNGWFYGLKKPLYAPKKVGILKVNKLDNQIEVSFSPTTIYSQKLTVNIAQLGFGLFNKIKSGENSGKLLRHDFVALSLQQQPLIKKLAKYTATVELNKPSNTSALTGIAVWITHKNDPTPIQSIGGYLNE